MFLKPKGIVYPYKCLICNIYEEEKERNFNLNAYGYACKKCGKPYASGKTLKNIKNNVLVNECVCKLKLRLKNY